MTKLLLEDSWQFTPVRAKITESKVNLGGKDFSASVIPGILSQCDTTNGNGRRYSRRVWEKNLEQGSRLSSLVSRNQAWGILEHPENGVVNAASPISHMVTGLKLNDKGILEGNIVIFEDLPDGHKLKVLIANGWDPLVSSRGYGSVSRASDGVDEVQEDFVCEGWDVVSTPSFAICALSPQRESSAQVPRPVSHVAENQAPVPMAPKPSINTNTMNDINTLKTLVEGLGKVDILTASAATVSESFAQIQSLHTQISEHSVANPTSSYVCNQLHGRLESLVANWHGKITAQTENLRRSETDLSKMTALAEGLAKTATTYRTTLTKVVAAKNSLSKVFETAVSRGRKWVSLAESRKVENIKLEEQCQIACDAVDILARRTVLSEKDLSDHRTALKELAEKYHFDTSRLARKLAEMQHPEKFKDAALAEKLKACKTVDAVVALTESFSKPAKTASPAPAPAPAPAPTATPAPAPVTESQAAPAPAPAAAPLIIQEATKIVSGDMIQGHALSVDQTVNIALRGSRTATATK